MYLWRIGRLKSDLAKNRLPESEKFKYLLVEMVLTAIGASLPSPVPTSGMLGLLGGLARVVLTACGVFYCYERNGGKEGKCFLGRFVSILWVIGVRTAVLVGVPTLIAAKLIESSLELAAEPAAWLTMGREVAVCLFIYWRTGSHIYDVAHVEPEQA